MDGPPVQLFMSTKSLRGENASSFSSSASVNLLRIFTDLSFRNGNNPSYSGFKDSKLELNGTEHRDSKPTTHGYITVQGFTGQTLVRDQLH